MADKRDDLTQANEQANEAFNKSGSTPAKKPEDAEDTQDVNEAADAEFNADGQDDVLGNAVGGIRGPSD